MFVFFIISEFALGRRLDELGFVGLLEIIIV